MPPGRTLAGRLENHLATSQQKRCELCGDTFSIRRGGYTKHKRACVAHHDQRAALLHVPLFEPRQAVIFRANSINSLGKLSDNESIN